MFFLRDPNALPPARGVTVSREGLPSSSLTVSFDFLRILLFSVHIHISSSSIFRWVFLPGIRQVTKAGSGEKERVASHTAISFKRQVD